MKDSATVEWLSKAIGEATKSAKFCVSGSLPIVDPGIVVKGIGPVEIPLKRTKKKLIEACRIAPYGKGTETLVDETVRKTFELDPNQFQLSDEWDEAMAEAMPSLAEQLGLPRDRLEARLYKLLVYERGGFFKPHRDSEKHDRMLASMIVVLPNPFEGGALIVRHGSERQTLRFDEAKKGAAPCYAAFYADCEHEVESVYSGVRLCLAYNLVLQSGHEVASSGSKATPPAEVLSESIGTWIARWPGKPLVFALEHHYTEQGLSLDLLKGADRSLAELVIAAAEKSNCNVNLSQVSRHLLQDAHDGYGYERRSSRFSRRSGGALEIGETYEDELNGDQWTDMSGNKQPWGKITFDKSAIVSSMPLDSWTPTSEDYEGYTGNAGNTLDRWYHRSAIVVWHRDHHFDVLASTGAIHSIPLFASMAAKLAKTPKKRLEEARLDCIRFARAIIARWTDRNYRFWRRGAQEKSPTDGFQERLLALHDRDTIALFLAKLAEVEESPELGSFIVAVCREFGWTTFAEELKRLMSPRPNARGDEGLPLAEAQWLAAFCCEKTEDKEKHTLDRELCALALQRFSKQRVTEDRHGWRYGDRGATDAEKSLPYLIEALAASGDHEGLTKAIDTIRGLPRLFTFDNAQVPCLKRVIPWARKELGCVPPQLTSWLSAVRGLLEEATLQKPEPPTDWTRPSEVDCKCEFCKQLNAFLRDSKTEVARIPAREESREHLISHISRYQCDVKHALERKGSPFSLVLTKTMGSFERAVKRFEADCRLLSKLPVS